MTREQQSIALLVVLVVAHAGGWTPLRKRAPRTPRKPKPAPSPAPSPAPAPAPAIPPDIWQSFEEYLLELLRGTRPGSSNPLPRQPLPWQAP